ncbi:MAG: UvrD-helicase domain-containing protein [Deltaproteobacteria bacterium]|nr:UvrD-helicase domain-containing protein [Deltaproteobacteria bacterium]
MKSLESFLETISRKSTWVLSETRLRTALLNQWIETVGKQECLRALTVNDCLLEILNKISLWEAESLYSRLSPRETELAFHALIESSRTAFSTLTLSLRDWMTASAEGFLIGPPSEIVGIKTFIDNVRLHETDEVFFKAAIDEWGNAKEDKRRLEELILLRDKYQAFMRDERRVDQVEVLAILVEKLDSERFFGRAGALGLPEAIVLAEPNIMHALERRLWLKIARLVELHVLVPPSVLNTEDELKPSNRRLASMRSFVQQDGHSFSSLHELYGDNASRESTVQFVFDGDSRQKKPSEGISVWRCDTRRQEVRKAAEAISHAVSKKIARPSDFHLIALNLDAYLNFIQEEFSRVGMQYSMAKGKPLRHSAPALAAKLYFNWLERPSLETAYKYYKNSFVATPQLDSEKLDRFVKSHSDCLEQISASKVFEDTFGGFSWGHVTKLPPSLNIFSLYQEFKYLGSQYALIESENWARPILEYYGRKLSNLDMDVYVSAASRQALCEQCLEMLKNLAILDGELQTVLSLLKLHTSCAELGAAIRKEFFRGRARLRILREAIAGSEDSGALEDLRVFVKSSRELRRVFSSAISSISFQSRISGKQAGGFRAFMGHFFSHLGSASLLSPIDPNAVAVSELLDVRGMRDKFSIVLGATAESFPLGSDSGESAGPFQVEHVYQTHIQKMFESYGLMSHLIRSARELVIAYCDREEIACSNIPATFVRALESLARGGLQDLEVLQCPKETQLEPFGNGVSLPLDDESRARARELLSSRSGSEFTAYDGMLSPGVWDLCLGYAEGQGFVSGEVNRYSVSSLEMLADCAHRFYFRYVLGLSTKERSYLDEVNAEIGSIVHSCLERFFSHYVLRGESVGKDNFSSACQLMLKIAKERFLESDIDWTSHPLLRGARQKVIAGLEHGQYAYSGKQGFLRAAIFYQVEFLETWPKYLEYSFGRGLGSGRALSLRHAGERGEVLISGVIDRIDVFKITSNEGQVEAESKVAIWDYKTSKYPPTLREVEGGSSLQMALYAAAVRQNILLDRYPYRGGIIHLAKPNRRDAEMLSLRKGVLIEHLAAAAGNKNASAEYLDETEVERRVEWVKSRVLSLDSLARDGWFCQNLETESCFVCEFNKICARNEVLLDRKLGNHSGRRAIVSKSGGDTARREVFHSTKGVNAKLSPEQEEASQVSSSVALIAGAGSGKTQVLQTRILRLILSGEPAQSILAITFTEKAAWEIKRRVEDAIWNAIRSSVFEDRLLSEVERQRLLEAASIFPVVQISTIHSFASSVISAAGGVAEACRIGNVVSSLQQREMILEATREILTHGDTAREVDAILEQGVSYKCLEEEVVKMVSSPRTLEGLANYVDCGEVERYRDSHRGVRHVLKGLLRQIRDNAVGKVGRFLEEWIAAFLPWLSSSDDGGMEELQKETFEVLGHKVSEVLAAIKADEMSDELIARLAELEGFLDEHKAFAKRKSKHNPRNFWKELREEIIALNPQSLNWNLEREMEGVKIAQTVCRFARKALEKYSSKKKQGGLVDFEDLVIEARRILCVPSEGSEFAAHRAVVAKLRRKFRHIMVDEFQDTDNYQWDIVRAIAKGGGDSADRSVFLVGDCHQAIYGFRGGDVRVFSRAAREIVDSFGRILTLRDNYRTRPEILRFINCFFNELFSARQLDSGDASIANSFSEFYPMIAKRANEETSGEIAAVSVLDVGGNISGRSGAEILEAENVALFIESVLSSLEGETAECSARWSRLQNVATGRKIAVLCRTSKQLLLMAQALLARGIEHSVSHSSGFYDLEEIVYLEALLRFLNDPTNSIYLVGLLRSPLLGLSDRELVELYYQLGCNWNNCFETNQAGGVGGKYTAAVKKIKKWIALSKIMLASRMLALIVTENGVCEAYQAVGRSDAASNLQFFIDELRSAELENESDGSILGALNFLEARRWDSGKSMSGDESSYAVVLMTIHGAKGLEFPMVILPFLSARKRADGGDFISARIALRNELGTEEEFDFLGIKVEDENADYKRSETLVSRAIREQNRGLSIEEEKRLFYVACTRARDYLVLPLRHSRSFSSEQKTIEKKSKEEKCEVLEFSDSPYNWLRHILVTDDPDSPSRWIMHDSCEDTPIELPVVKLN